MLFDAAAAEVCHATLPHVEAEQVNGKLQKNLELFALSKILHTLIKPPELTYSGLPPRLVGAFSPSFRYNSRRRMHSSIPHILHQPRCPVRGGAQQLEWVVLRVERGPSCAECLAPQGTQNVFSRTRHQRLGGNLAFFFYPLPPAPGCGERRTQLATEACIARAIGAIAGACHNLATSRQ